MSKPEVKDLISDARREVRSLFEEQLPYLSHGECHDVPFKYVWHSIYTDAVSACMNTWDTLSRKAKNAYLRGLKSYEEQGMFGGENGNWTEAEKVKYIFELVCKEQEGYAKTIWYR